MSKAFEKLRYSIQHWLTGDSSFSSLHTSLQRSAQSSSKQWRPKRGVESFWKDCPTKSPAASPRRAVGVFRDRYSSSWADDLRVSEFDFTAGGWGVFSLSTSHCFSSLLIHSFHLPWVGPCSLSLTLIKTPRANSPTSFLFLTDSMFLQSTLWFHISAERYYFNNVSWDPITM